MVDSISEDKNCEVRLNFKVEQVLYSEKDEEDNSQIVKVIGHDMMTKEQVTFVADFVACTVSIGVL